jgi:hypothetical protein
MSQSTNHRKLRRYHKRVMVRFGAQGALICSGVIENVSARGIYLTSTRIFPPGTALAIEFHADEKAHRMEGIVRWARRAPANLIRVTPSGMGIELTLAPEAFYSLLMTLETQHDMRAEES